MEKVKNKKRSEESILINEIKKGASDSELNISEFCGTE